MNLESGFHVTMTTGEREGEIVFGVHVSQRDDDGNLDEFVRLSYSTSEEAEQTRDLFLDALHRAGEEGTSSEARRGELAQLAHQIQNGALSGRKTLQ